MIAAFMPLIFFVLMSAFVFYIACRSHSAFKFEFNSNGFESIKRFQKKKMFSYSLTNLGLKPGRPDQPFLSLLSRMAHFSQPTFPVNWPNGQPVSESVPDQTPWEKNRYRFHPEGDSPLFNLNRILHEIGFASR
jgi:hypothetical protein